MKRPLTLLLLATAAAGIAVSGVASAAPEPGGLVPGLPSDPYACDGDAIRRAQAQADPQILSYLSVHPDLESELVRIHGLPAARRSAEWQAYGRAHSDGAAGY